MPTSDYHQISDVLHVVEQIGPRTVLDVGVGFGKWGLLCREVLEVYQRRLHKESWEVRIDGIEIHEPYRNELWDLAYNRIHVGNADSVIDSLGKYDLILCCDVIEHFNKNEGLRFLEKLIAHGTIVIVTSPRGFAPQEPVYDNPFERHRSGWDDDDFRDFVHLYKEIGFTFMAVLGHDRLDIECIEVIHPLKVLGFKKATRELLRLAVNRFRERLS